MAEVEQIAHEIVEELRAEIDFEIDDVISRIVLSLPEEYFRMLSRADQLKHLKALLALGVCDIQDDIMMRSGDGRFVAVVAKRNYPGMLAAILNRLPDSSRLIGAKIFTSKEHDFIIDLFEFKSESAPQPTNAAIQFELEQIIKQVAATHGCSSEDVEPFVSQLNPESPSLGSVDQLQLQFSAYAEVVASGGVSIHWQPQSANASQLIVASGGTHAKKVFQQSAEFVGRHEINIEQAILNDFQSADQGRIAIASFRLEHQRASESGVAPLADELKFELTDRQ